MKNREQTMTMHFLIEHDRHGKMPTRTTPFDNLLLVKWNELNDHYTAPNIPLGNRNRIERIDGINPPPATTKTAPDIISQNLSVGRRQ